MKSSSYPKELTSKKWFEKVNVRVSRGSSLRVIFIKKKKYEGKFKGPQETVSDNKSLSYQVFELPGVNCMFF